MPKCRENRRKRLKRSKREVARLRLKPRRYPVEYPIRAIDLGPMDREFLAQLKCMPDTMQEMMDLILQSVQVPSSLLTATDGCYYAFNAYAGKGIWF